MLEIGVGLLALDIVKNGWMNPARPQLGASFFQKHREGIIEGTSKACLESKAKVSHATVSGVSFCFALHSLTLLQGAVNWLALLCMLLFCFALLCIDLS